MPRALSFSHSQASSSGMTRALITRISEGLICSISTVLLAKVLPRAIRPLLSAVLVTMSRLRCPWTPNSTTKWDSGQVGISHCGNEEPSYNSAGGGTSGANCLRRPPHLPCACRWALRSRRRSQIVVSYRGGVYVAGAGARAAPPITRNVSIRSPSENESP